MVFGRWAVMCPVAPASAPPAFIHTVEFAIHPANRPNNQQTLQCTNEHTAQKHLIQM